MTTKLKSQDVSKITAEIAASIRDGLKLTTANIISIGRKLFQAKELLEHGEWLPWLAKECLLSERSAQRYMQAARFATKYATVADLVGLSPSALYWLSSLNDHPDPDMVEAEKQSFAAVFEAAKTDHIDEWEAQRIFGQEMDRLFYSKREKKNDDDDQDSEAKAENDEAAARANAGADDFADQNADRWRNDPNDDDDAEPEREPEAVDLEPPKLADHLFGMQQAAGKLCNDASNWPPLSKNADKRRAKALDRLHSAFGDLIVIAQHAAKKAAKNATDKAA